MPSVDLHLATPPVRPRSDTLIEDEPATTVLRRPTEMRRPAPPAMRGATRAAIAGPPGRGRGSSHSPTTSLDGGEFEERTKIGLPGVASSFRRPLPRVAAPKIPVYEEEVVTTRVASNGHLRAAYPAYPMASSSVPAMTTDVAAEESVVPRYAPVEPRGRFARFRMVLVGAFAVTAAVAFVEHVRAMTPHHATAAVVATPAAPPTPSPIVVAPATPVLATQSAVSAMTIDAPAAPIGKHGKAKRWTRSTGAHANVKAPKPVKGTVDSDAAAAQKVANDQLHDALF